MLTFKKAAGLRVVLLLAGLLLIGALAVAGQSRGAEFQAKFRATFIALRSICGRGKGGNPRASFFRCRTRW